MKKIILLVFISVMSQAVQAMDFETAMKQNKPLALYVYMDYCSACKAFEPMYQMAYSKYSNKFNFVKENVKTRNMQQLCSDWKVNTMPMFALINPNGKSGKVPYSCMMDEKCLYKMLDDFK